MRRLRERQIVTLARADADGDGRGRRCCVLGVGRSITALYPIDREGRELRSPEGEHYLVFDFEGRPVVLRGVVRAVSAGDLRFEPSDGVALPRRAATRLTRRTAFEIGFIETEHRERVTTTTIDYSSDGALVEDPGLSGADHQVAFSFAPDGGDPIPGVADIVRRGDGQLALAFRPLDEPGRRRIIEHVIATKRAELERDVELALRQPAAATWP